MCGTGSINASGMGPFLCHQNVANVAYLQPRRDNSLHRQINGSLASRGQQRLQKKHKDLGWNHLHLHHHHHHHHHHHDESPWVTMRRIHPLAFPGKPSDQNGFLRDFVVPSNATGPYIKDGQKSLCWGVPCIPTNARCWSIKIRIHCLVGGWTNPSWKICSSNWIISPQIGMKIKNIWKPPPSCCSVWLAISSISYA